MTLKEIQAQYGDGVWLLLDFGGNPTALEGVFSKGVLHWCRSDVGNYHSWDYALDASNNFTIIDVEDLNGGITIAQYGQSINVEYAAIECTRETCPDIFKGHGPTCKYSRNGK